MLLRLFKLNKYVHINTNKEKQNCVISHTQITVELNC